MYRTCLALLGTGALALTGCGGDDASPPRDPPLTKRQFIARASAICRDVKHAQQPYSDRIDALPEGTAIKQAAPILAGALGESRKGLRRLRALPAPDEDRASLDAYFAAAEQVLDAHRQLAEAARAGDRPAGRRVAARTAAVVGDEARRAREYGLRDCGDVF